MRYAVPTSEDIDAGETLLDSTLAQFREPWDATYMVI
jgi:hypothetical protein